MRNPEFNKLLRKRPTPLNISKLAAALNNMGRSHLTQVLTGEREGKETWPLLASFLTHEEYQCARAYAERATSARVDTEVTSSQSSGSAS